jgi:hypothetical protein
MAKSRRLDRLPKRLPEPPPFFDGRNIPWGMYRDAEWRLWWMMDQGRYLRDNRLLTVTVPRQIRLDLLAEGGERLEWTQEDVR